MGPGDLQVKAIFKFNAEVRTEHCPDFVEYDDKNRPYIADDGSGKVITSHGYYLPRRYDFWLVIRVLNKDVWVLSFDFFQLGKIQRLQ